MRFRSAVTAAVIPIVSLTLAGCGESTIDKYVKTAPATVDQDMRAALASLTSVHVHTVQKLNSTPFTMDISVDNAGRCSGTLAEGSQTLNLISLGGGQLYAKGSADFWSGTEGVTAASASVLANKWVTGLPSGMFANTCSIKSLIDSFTKNTVAKDQAKVLGKTKVNGVDAVTLQITLSGSKVTIAVAADNPHRPLQVISPASKLTSVFTQFDQPVRPSAPAGAQDVSKLTGAK